ncbi:MAG: hypothetical protein ACP5NS_01235 [Candidatus Pacearchaeota archaeon]
MKLQKHSTVKGTKYFKWELVIPKDDVEIAEFSDKDELIAESKKGEIRIRKK